MLRPLYVDVLDALWPFALAALAFFIGTRARRFPAYVYIGSVILTVLVSLTSVVTYVFAPIDWLGTIYYWLGGAAALAVWSAFYLLGLERSFPKRMLSTGFAALIAALVGFALVVDCGGRLTWRFVGDSPWGNSVSESGFTGQTTGYTCAPASAAMMLHHYGVSTTEGEMAYQAGTTLMGSNLYNMKHAIARKICDKGWIVTTDSFDFDDCARRQEPFILYALIPRIGLHAVYVRNMAANTATIFDPLLGILDRVSREEIEGWQFKKVIRIETRK